jgi:hypothetical protein
VYKKLYFSCGGPQNRIAYFLLLAIKNSSIFAQRNCILFIVWHWPLFYFTLYYYMLAFASGTFALFLGHCK